MQILITGSSGFVGKNLHPCLKLNGFEVMTLTLRGDWKQNLPEQYDAVIHLAGKAHDTLSNSDPEEYFHVNTDLTKQLFDAFLEGKSKDFIYFSSVKAVADTVEDVLNESVVPAPKTPYGESKWLAEQYLNSRPLPAGKRLFILRPCMIHGPGNKGNLNLLYKVVDKGIPWPLAAFENRRSFLSIDNLNFIITGILENQDVSGGTYHLADDEALSTNELVKLIGKASEKRTSLWKISRKLIDIVAKVGDKLHLPLNSERLKKLTESYVVNNSKIKSALKIERLPVSSKEGLLKTLRSF